MKTAMYVAYYDSDSDSYYIEAWDENGQIIKEASSDWKYPSAMIARASIVRRLKQLGYERIIKSDKSE